MGCGTLMCGMGVACLVHRNIKVQIQSFVYCFSPIKGPPYPAHPFVCLSATSFGKPLLPRPSGSVQSIQEREHRINMPAPPQPHPHPQARLVLACDAAQNLNGLLVGGFRHRHRLEATLQRLAQGQPLVVVEASRLLAEARTVDVFVGVLLEEMVDLLI